MKFMFCVGTSVLAWSGVLSAQEVVEFWAKRQILRQVEDELTIESRPLVQLTRISKRPSGHPFAEPVFSPTHRDAR